MVAYLDHNATTPVHPHVARAVARALCDPTLQGNPASVHASGRRARERLEDARRRVARVVGAGPATVTFTSGGTESDALAVLGSARALRAASLPHGLLTSPLEHPAVGRAAEQLRGEGHPVHLLTPDRQGRIDPAAVAREARDHPDVGLVSLALANHELGNRYDIAAIVTALRAVRPGICVHCDAVQGLGKVPIDFAGWDLDLLSVSAHKARGPRGVGALVHRTHAEIRPLLTGGAQERGRRPGTPDLPAVIGFGVAADLIAAEPASDRARVEALRARVRRGVLALPGCEVIGDPAQHVGNTVLAAFAGCDGEMLAAALDLEGIEVAHGAACSAGTLAPSPVVLALGRGREVALSTLRISLGTASLDEDVDALLATLPAVLERVRASGRPGGSP